MKYIKFIIYPESSFGSIPMSDMLFGQVCCMLDRMRAPVGSMLANYDKKPFAVFSDMLPLDNGRKYISIMNTENQKPTKQGKIENLKKQKKIKKNNISPISSLLRNITDTQADKSDNEIRSIDLQIVRNSISRLTGTTGEEGFSPYSVISKTFTEGFYYTLYAYIEDEYRELVVSAFELMGKFGFGKDSSSGMGRFRVESSAAVEIKPPSSFNALYTLGNIILDGVVCNKAYYEPFTRFGRHGAERVMSGYPFKNPIVMARQGALILTDKLPDTAYIGKGVVSGLSYHTDTVHQGYSLYIPIEVKA